LACSMWSSWAFNSLASSPPPPPVPHHHPRGMALQVSLPTPHGVCPCHSLRGHLIRGHAFLPFPVFSFPGIPCQVCGAPLPLAMPLAPDDARGCTVRCKAHSVALCLLGILSPSRVCRDSVARVFRILIYTKVGVTSSWGDPSLTSLLWSDPVGARRRRAKAFRRRAP